MTTTTLEYDPFLCEECSKYGYCIKKKNQQKDVRNIIAQKEKIEIKNAVSIYQEEKVECLEY